MNSTCWRTVIDCNVFVQAAATHDGAAAQVLRLFDQSRIKVYVSRTVIKELRDVLNYPKVRRKLTSLTDERVSEFLRRITYRAIAVSNVPRRFNYPRAHQDEPYLDLSVAVQAQYLLSRDNDLLSLQGGHSNFAKRFRQLCPGIRVVKPEDFLAETIGR